MELYSKISVINVKLVIFTRQKNKEGLVMLEAVSLATGLSIVIYAKKS